MKILFLTNNKLTHDLFNWLKNEKGENVVLYIDKISIEKLREIQPDFIISYNYKYIIQKDVIEAMNNKIINLHIAFLPWNRGASPNLWSFLDDTCKGVTIHEVDEGLDTGDILFQKEVFFDESKETLKSSYNKLHEEIQNLFKENWDKIKENKILAKPQIGKGSMHSINDSKFIESITQSWDVNIIELKKKYKESISNTYGNKTWK